MLLVKCVPHHNTLRAIVEQGEKRFQSSMACILSRILYNDSQFISLSSVHEYVQKGVFLASVNARSLREGAKGGREEIGPVRCLDPTL